MWTVSYLIYLFVGPENGMTLFGTRKRLGSRQPKIAQTLRLQWFQKWKSSKRYTCNDFRSENRSNASPVMVSEVEITQTLCLQWFQMWRGQKSIPKTSAMLHGSDILMKNHQPQQHFKMKSLQNKGFWSMAKKESAPNATPVVVSEIHRKKTS